MSLTTFWMATGLELSFFSSVFLKTVHKNEGVFGKYPLRFSQMQVCSAWMVNVVATTMASEVKSGPVGLR